MGTNRVSPVFRTMTALVVIGAATMLGGCLGSIGNTSLDDLNYAKPAGTAFDTALYDNYRFIALSFGDVGEAKRSVFDFNGSWSLNSSEKDIANLANAYAAKAVLAAQGAFIDPETSVDPASHEIRDRLLRALEPGREAFPRDAARVQTDYDCWMLNSTVPAQKGAADRCKTSLDKTLPRLEAEAKSFLDAQAAAAAAAAKNNPTPQPQP